MWSLIMIFKIKFMFNLSIGQIVLVVVLGVPLAILAFWYILTILKFFWIVGRDVFEEL